MIRSRAQIQAHPTKPAAKFATIARAVILRSFPDSRAQETALRGPVGDIYRDLYYRLHLFYTAVPPGASEYEGRDTAAAILTDPARILIDAFLDGFETQDLFARATDLDKGNLSRLFKVTLRAETPNPGSPGQDYRLSLDRFAAACRKLCIVPGIIGKLPTGADECRAFADPLQTSPSSVTWRERRLGAAVAAATRFLCALPTHFEPSLQAARDFLAFQLSLIYGPSRVHLLDELTDTFFADILTFPDDGSLHRFDPKTHWEEAPADATYFFHLPENERPILFGLSSHIELLEALWKPGYGAPGATSGIMNTVLTLRLPRRENTRPNSGEADWPTEFLRANSNAWCESVRTFNKWQQTNSLNKVPKRIQHNLQLPFATSVFNALGITPKNLADIPPELRPMIDAAIDRYLRLVARDFGGDMDALRDSIKNVPSVSKAQENQRSRALMLESLKQFDKRMPVVRANSPQGYAQTHKKTLDAIIKGLEATALVKEFGHGPHYELDFEAVIRTEVGQSAKVICLFPFFLTPARESSWFVIPYAHHAALGLCFITRQADAKTIIKGLLNESAGTAQSNGNSYVISESDNPNQLVKSLAALRKPDQKQDLRLYGFQGYAISEMFTENIKRMAISPSRPMEPSGITLLQEACVTRLTTIDALRDANASSGTTVNAEAARVQALVKTIKEDLEKSGGKAAVLLYDIADQKTLKGPLRSEIATLGFELVFVDYYHNLKNSFPVGVGLSLYALPILLKANLNGLWLDFKQSMAPTLTEAATALTAMGMTLSASFAGNSVPPD